MLKKELGLPGAEVNPFSTLSASSCAKIIDFPQTLHTLWSFVPYTTFSTADSMPLAYPQKFGWSSWLADYTGTNHY